MHWYVGVSFAGMNKTMLVAHLIKIAPKAYSQTIAKNAADAQGQGCQITLASLKTDMCIVYTVMSKGKWEKQQLLEIQHGLTGKEEGSKGKSMEKTIRDAVDDAMKKWKAANEQAGTEKGRGSKASRDTKVGNQLVGATITPELLAMLLQGATVQNTQGGQTGGAGQGRAALICYRCGLEGHQANACTNPCNPPLVNQQV